MDPEPEVNYSYSHGFFCFVWCWRFLQAAPLCLVGLRLVIIEFYLFFMKNYYILQDDNTESIKLNFKSKGAVVKGRRFKISTKMSAVMNYVELLELNRGGSSKFELAISFPKRVFSRTTFESEKTLKELGISSNTVMWIAFDDDDDIR